MDILIIVLSLIMSSIALSSTMVVYYEVLKLNLEMLSTEEESNLTLLKVIDMEIELDKNNN